MAKRSLKASEAGRTRAKQAFERTGWTQENLAYQVGLETRQSVWKFFSGRPVERHIFIDLCFQLDLDWQDIVDLPDLPPAPELSIVSKPATNDWVQTARSHLHGKLQTQCGMLQASLDLSQPLQLDQIYTHVNLQTRLTSKQWLDVAELQANCVEGERRCLNSPHPETIPGLEVVSTHTKLVILGKPGSGKTTFLQHMALQCDAGQLKPDCLPIFISLRTFATVAQVPQGGNLLNYISEIFQDCGLEADQVSTLAQEGKLLLLLDGLDEVALENSKDVVAAIQQFCDRFHQNAVFITCRIAAQPYQFRGFTYVELADFNQAQIATFAHHYYHAIHSQADVGQAKAEQFLEQLRQRENQPLLELVGKPLLLSLICSVFRERSQFPNNRAKLYQVSLDILLSRWDQARGIERDQPNTQLSLPEKIKLLSQIAALTFEQGNYFFEKWDVLQITADYLATLPNAITDPETLWLESEKILKTIELQHGLLVERAKDVYSFSHLTFQEYLTARKIVASLGSQDLIQNLQQLANHVFDPRWREVILLTVNLLPQPDAFLKQLQVAIDTLLCGEDKLQQALAWIETKVNALKRPENAVAARAFYLGLYLQRDLNLAMALDASFAHDLPSELGLDLALARALSISLSLLEHPTLKQILNLGFALDCDRRFELTEVLSKGLQHLKNKLLDPVDGQENLLNWWQQHGAEWTHDFRQLLITERSIGQDLSLSQHQHQLWQQYYQANQFFVECLHNASLNPPNRQMALKAQLLRPQSGTSSDH